MNSRQTFATSDSSERLELLLFNVGSVQPFGINVLKVKEVIATPAMTKLPHSHHSVRGVAHLRGEPLTVIDLAAAIGRGSCCGAESGVGSVIITEFNRTMQGFLVRAVDRIVICEWSAVLPPPRGSGVGSYITGVTDIEGALVQIIDVEKVLGEVVHVDPVQFQTAGNDNRAELAGRRVMVVDDSSLARSQTMKTLTALGLDCVIAHDGAEAIKMLQELNGAESEWPVDMVISDIEMPEMDGYTLTSEIRKIPSMSQLYVLLHTSLNGAINKERAERVGANSILTKFAPDELAQAVRVALI
ncbi:MAG: chemotaxis protein [Chromatiales bacterium]|nr:chemotaxis protein [Chromatiales bacterium]